jgi:hypothetical protein
MDHSMLTAMDAVKSMIDPTAFKKEDIWKVNTETDYAEEKGKAPSDGKSK